MNPIKLEKVLIEIYRRTYDASTPKGDWDALIKNAEINEYGQKVIPFNDYELDDEVADKIINDVLKEYKVPKYQHQMVKNSYWLGCCPKSK